MLLCQECEEVFSNNEWPECRDKGCPFCGSHFLDEMKEPFVQKNGDRLRVVDNRLYRLMPMPMKCSLCDARYKGCSAKFGIECAQLFSAWEEITGTLSKKIRRRYGK